jgi:CRISPR system Cascade subunit CasB
MLQQPLFKPDTEINNVLREWWKSLENNKGDRAALRRCHQTAQVLFVPAYHELCVKLRQHGRLKAEQLPAVAGLLAHVKKDIDKELPKQMATPKTAGGEPVLSELRFRRLLQCQSQEELFPALRRVVRLLDGNVNLYSLAESVYWWGHADWGERVRQHWAYAYYEST